MFLEIWSLQGLARTGTSLLLSRNVCVVCLPKKATDLLLVCPHNASAAIDLVMSNCALVHQGEAVKQAASAQPLPGLTASGWLLPVVMPLPCDTCTWKEASKHHSIALILSYNTPVIYTSKADHINWEQPHPLEKQIWEKRILQ